MPFVDWSLILSYIIALSAVALPVEIFFTATLYTIKRQLTSPERRAELIDEAAAAFWEPFKEPTQRKELIGEVVQAIWQPFSTPENRSRLLSELWLQLDKLDKQKLISELGHGVIRVVKENEGSLKGIAVRQAKSELLELAKGGGAGALAALPGKFELPIVGKVTIGEALQIASSINDLVKGVKVGAGQVVDMRGGSSSSATQLP